MAGSRRYCAPSLALKVPECLHGPPPNLFKANVLFTAAFHSDAGRIRLWKLPGAELIISVYATEEAGKKAPPSWAIGGS